MQALFYEFNVNSALSQIDFPSLLCYAHKDGIILPFFPRMTRAGSFLIPAFLLFNCIQDPPVLIPISDRCAVSALCPQVFPRSIMMIKEKLNTLSLSELRKIAKEKNVKHITSLRKSELVDLLSEIYEKELQDKIEDTTQGSYLFYLDRYAEIQFNIGRIIK